MAGFGDSDCIKTALDLVGIRESIPKYGFFGPDVEIRPYFKEAVLVLDELLDANVTPYKANHLVQFLTIDDDHIKKTMIDSIKTRVLKIIAKSGDDMAIEKLFESYPEGASFIAYDRLDFLSRHLDKTDQFFVVRAMTNARDEHHKKFFDTLLKRISKNENIPQ